jgi:hypothetical protein
MHIVIGPVLTREGGYACPRFLGRPDGLRRGYTCCRIEHAQYARTTEIRCHDKGCSDGIVA